MGRIFLSNLPSCWDLFRGIFSVGILLLTFAYLNNFQITRKWISCVPLLMALQAEQCISVLIACLWLLLHHFQTVVGTIGSLSSWRLSSANKNICIPLSERFYLLNMKCRTFATFDWVNSVTDITSYENIKTAVKYWLLIIWGKLDHKYIKYAGNRLCSNFHICFSLAMASIFCQSISDSLGLFHCLLGGALWVPWGDNTGRGSVVAATQTCHFENPAPVLAK